MSTRQQAIIDTITAHTEKHGYPPSMREIRDAVGLKSISTLHGHLIRMQKQGVIEWEPSNPRTLKVLCTGRAIFIGQIRKRCFIRSLLVGREAPISSYAGRGQVVGKTLHIM